MIKIEQIIELEIDYDDNRAIAIWKKVWMNIENKPKFSRY